MGCHCRAVLLIGSAPPRFAQADIQNQREQDADRAEQVKRESPSVPLRQQRRKPASKYGPGINCRLMPGKSARPRLTAMVIAQQTERSGEIESFAQPGQRPHNNESGKPAAESCSESKGAPDDAGGQNHMFAGNAIDQQTGGQAESRIDPGKSRHDPAQLYITKPKFLLEQRE